jgi:coatomer protein complex subunit gamma
MKGEEHYVVDRTAVLQESRLFDERHLDANKCVGVLSRLLMLINQGEELADNEVSTLFFRVSKLFQSQDTLMRRLVYLMLKELKPKEDVSFIVVSSLTQDFSRSNDHFKANALRVLMHVLDPSLLAQNERYVKTALVDRSEAVAKAAMIVGIHFMRSCSEVVKRWVAEVQDKLSGKSNSLHFIALVLLYSIKRNDPVALIKLLSAMTRNFNHSPLAHMQQVRYCVECLRTLQVEQSVQQAILTFLETSLHKPYDILVLEAARGILELGEIARPKHPAALSSLSAFLSSNKSSSRFAALRTLHNYSMKCPEDVATLYTELEPLINDSNTSIATLAISTLLRISEGSNVDTLLQKITAYMNEISDEFKQDIICSIKGLAVRSPKVARQLLSFMGASLTPGATFPLKHTIVKCFLEILRELPEIKDLVLLNLAEFCEECDSEILQAHILHVLGEHGPHSEIPTKLFRSVYNRLVLDGEAVRAAAVTCAAKFGGVPELQVTVVNLLTQFEEDPDDEVRERACACLNSLRAGRPARLNPIRLSEIESAARKCKESNEFFSLGTQPISKAKAAEVLTHAQAVVEEDSILTFLKQFGPITSSSSAVMLTEKTAEYVVRLTKHLLPEHIGLQFSVDNTMDSVALADVHVQLQLYNSPFVSVLGLDEGVVERPAERINPKEIASVFVVLKKPSSAAVCSVAASLKFRVLELEGQEVIAAYDDEYQIEHVAFSLADFATHN